MFCLAYYESQYGADPGTMIFFTVAGVMMLVLAVTIVGLVIAQAISIIELRKIIGFPPPPDLSNPAELARIRSGLVSGSIHVRRVAIQQAGWCGEAGAEFVPALEKMAKNVNDGPTCDLARAALKTLKK